MQDEHPQDHGVTVKPISSTEDIQAAAAANTHTPTATSVANTNMDPRNVYPTPTSTSETIEHKLSSLPFGNSDYSMVPGTTSGGIASVGVGLLVVIGGIVTMYQSLFKSGSRWVLYVGVGFGSLFAFYLAAKSLRERYNGNVPALVGLIISVVILLYLLLQIVAYIYLKTKLQSSYPSY